MKKIGVVLTIALLLTIVVFSSYTKAQEPQEKYEVVEDNTQPKQTYKYEVIEKFDSFSNKELTIPKDFQWIAKNIFRIESNVPRIVLAVSLMVWLIFLLLFINIMTGFSPFSQGVSIAVGVLLSFLASVIGMTAATAKTIIKIGDYIKFLEKWGNGATLVILFIFIGFALLVAKILKRWSEKKEVEKAHEEGIKAGSDIAAMGWIRRILEKIG